MIHLQSVPMGDPRQAHQKIELAGVVVVVYF